MIMENNKWLKRKYPKSHKKIRKFLNDTDLNRVKKYGYKIGVLTVDIIDCSKYKKGTLCYFQRRSIHDKKYPLCYCIVKCKIGVTSSGYQSIQALNNDIKELKS